MLNMSVREDLKKAYQKVLYLMALKSLGDPDEQPHKSKYEAKNVLLGMEEIILMVQDLSDPTSPDYLHFRAVLAIVYCRIGMICVETEEPTAGEEYFMKAYNVIPDHLNKDFLLCSISLRNQLGILWAQRSELEKAQAWLEGAKTLYDDFMKLSPPQVPATFLEIFDLDEESLGMKELEQLHTLSVFYSAQVYGSMEDLVTSVVCCHDTLRRQLTFGEYESVDWALNCATLSQCFMERILFTQARHHLAAASCVLEEYENSLNNIVATNGEAALLKHKKEEMQHCSADVSRCWVKYGIFLLEYSKNALNNSADGYEPTKEDETLKNLWFTLDVSRFENEVVDSKVTSYEDARKVFLFTQKHIKKAKEYYTLEYRASDYVQIVQDHSQLFRHLTAFENEEDKQCKMIKRRTDLLQGVVKELNPQYYLNVCRQLWFELGECYHDAMHIKIGRLIGSNGTPTPHALKKINYLAEQSIDSFGYFLDSVKDKSTKELPNVLEEDLTRPTLYAHFYKGRIYHKIITLDRARQIENENKSYECFKYVVDYCERNDFAKKMMQDEYTVSKEMMTLLHLKVLKI